MTSRPASTRLPNFGPVVRVEDVVDRFPQHEAAHRAEDQRHDRIERRLEFDFLSGFFHSGKKEYQTGQQKERPEHGRGVGDHRIEAVPGGGPASPRPRATAARCQAPRPAFSRDSGVGIGPVRRARAPKGQQLRATPAESPTVPPRAASRSLRVPLRPGEHPRQPRTASRMSREEHVGLVLGLPSQDLDGLLERGERLLMTAAARRSPPRFCKLLQEQEGRRQAGPGPPPDSDRRPPATRRAPPHDDRFRTGLRQVYADSPQGQGGRRRAGPSPAAEGCRRIPGTRRGPPRDARGPSSV